MAIAEAFITISLREIDLLKVAGPDRSYDACRSGRMAPKLAMATDKELAQ